MERARMFYHMKNQCGGNIFAQTKITVLSGFSVSPEGINPTGRSKITIDTERKDGVVFVCNSCREEIANFSDIVSSCMFCGTIHPVTELYYIKGSGGIFCQEHAISEFPDSQRIRLSVIFAKK